LKEPHLNAESAAMSPTKLCYISGIIKAIGNLMAYVKPKSTCAPGKNNIFYLNPLDELKLLCPYK